ncbi:MAG: aldehyde dehydrogenase family protein [Oscillatoria sp. PMC 1051.18]|nr:aldehyde dehydrogenase family protein [Oscillatoria sp. PMC 1050.18]MEC5032237.1 aldehyde dehydrogenase family protein [Oscillatoria sp. PMC 1051.18]
MQAALLLIDLQEDFLSKPNLEPSAGEIVRGTTILLQGCRHYSLPVIHIWTTISPKPDNRMPHWQKQGRFLCLAGTPGHAVPPSLRPVPQEFIIHKTFYSGFENGELADLLEKLKIDTLLVAGIYLHGCVRETVLDAYQKGYKIWIAEDATGSDDGLHGAISLRYLQARAAQFATVETLLSLVANRQRKHLETVLTLPSGIAEQPLLASSSALTWIHKSPRNLSETLWQVPIADAVTLEELLSNSQETLKDWQSFSLCQRQELLHQFATLLEQEKLNFVRQLAIEIGKPITQGEAEVNRAISLLKTVAKYGEDALPVAKGIDRQYRYSPVGKIALITPWNNPLAIAIGKIAPALVYGNTVIWKPAPAGSAIAIKVKELFDRLDCPSEIVTLVLGDRTTALMLMAHPEIDAVSLSGSSRAGYAAQEICARRRIPLQAELGGNNGAIVWSDCELERAAKLIVAGAFGFAGQRCTANRRAIVDADCYEAFVNHLVKAMEELHWGDPLAELTQVGPLISQQQRDRVAALIERSAVKAEMIYALSRPEIQPLGSYYPPTLVCCDNPTQEIVEEETFGPVLVVQKARNLQQAIALNNRLKQGLVAALFSASPQRHQDFLQKIKAGILKINYATADVDVDLPFGGWKHSGVGSPEHSVGDREFYTRLQSIYWHQQ